MGRPGRPRLTDMTGHAAVSRLTNLPIDFSRPFAKRR
jgi:hypothetical protein